MVECKFCKRQLKTDASLKIHQKTAKFCLNARGEIKKGKFICKFCDRDFTQKTHLNNHMNSHDSVTLETELLQRKNKELEETNKLLTQRIELLEKEKAEWIKLAKRPTITNNNKINITQNLSIFNKTVDEIEKIVQENYNKEHLIEGQKGAARFTHAHVLKTETGQLPYYEVADKTRCHGRYRSSENETVKDNHMVGLSERVFYPIKKKAIDIYNSLICNNPEYDDGFTDTIHMNQDNLVFRTELAKHLLNHPEMLTIELADSQLADSQSGKNQAIAKDSSESGVSFVVEDDN